MHIKLLDIVKQAVKKHRFSNKPLVRLIISILYFLRNKAGTARRICVDPGFRSVFILQLLNSKNVHQTTPFTCMNRYPKIFSSCCEYFKGKKELKILSYGCSTGEEVLTLRQYFPAAHIIGAEINKRSLAICRKLPGDEKINFIYSTHKELQKYGPYDAIFCMAVLQRKPHYIASEGITSLKKIYPFEKFERQIIELDEMVKPQGLLVIHFTQYSLEETSVASKYKSWGNNNQDDYKTSIFDKNSKLINNQVSQNTIFVKIVP